MSKYCKQAIQNAKLHPGQGVSSYAWLLAIAVLAATILGFLALLVWLQSSRRRYAAEQQTLAISQE